MKTLVLIISMFAMVVYARNVKIFHAYYKECAKNLNVPATNLNADVFVCAIMKIGPPVDEQGGLIKSKVIERYEKAISDPAKLALAKMFVSICFAKVKNDDPKTRTIQIIKCLIPTVPLIDKN